MNQFLEFIHQRLLATLPASPNLNIAVVSHGTFLSNNLRPDRKNGICAQEMKAKTLNDQVMAVTYKVSLSGIRETGCRQVFEGSSKPSDICEQDFASCRLGGNPLKVSTGKCTCMVAPTKAAHTQDSDQRGPHRFVQRDERERSRSRSRTRSSISDSCVGLRKSECERRASSCEWNFAHNWRTACTRRP